MAHACQPVDSRLHTTEPDDGGDNVDDLIAPADADGGTPSRFGRRTFIAGLASIPLLSALGPLSACSPNLPSTVDTFNGLLAMLVPGDDAYSRRQGVTRAGPGGVGSGAAPFVIDTYRRALPIPLVFPGVEVKVPIQLFIEAVLNSEALAVNPLAGTGPFKSAFANLSYADKVEVLRRLEEDRPIYDGTILRFLFNTLPTLTTFVAYSEAPVFDKRTRTITRRPVGWDLTAYPGVADGRDEFIGYYRGVTEI